jgi:hypothetical protein
VGSLGSSTVAREEVVVPAAPGRSDRGLPLALGAVVRAAAVLAAVALLAGCLGTSTGALVVVAPAPVVPRVLPLPPAFLAPGIAAVMAMAVGAPMATAVMGIAQTVVMVRRARMARPAGLACRARMVRPAAAPEPPHRKAAGSRGLPHTQV